MRIFQRRRFWVWSGGLILFALLGLLALPTLVGAKWLYKPLLERLEADGFRLEIESVRFRWFTPIVLKGIELKQEGGPNLLTIDEVRSNRGLLGFLVSGRNLGRIDIQQPTIDIELLSDSTNLSRLIKALEGKRGESSKQAGNDPSGSKQMPAMDLDVVVHGLSARVQRQEEPRPLVIVPPWDLHLSYRATEGESRLIVEPTTVLKKVDLTPELIQLGLGLAVPLLAESAWFDGQVSLSIGRAEIPLEHPEQAVATGELTLHHVRSGPSQPTVVQLIDLIARLRDREPNHELVFVDGSRIQIKVADGKVFHEGLEAGLPKIDDRLQITTSGSVGLLDKSLNLVLRCPVPIALLAKKERVKELGIPMVQVPIVGTLEDPKVEWDVLRGDSSDLLGLIREKVQDDSPGTAAILGTLEKVTEGDADGAISFAASLAKEIRARRQGQKEAGPDGNPKPPENPEKNRPVRDAIRDLFRGKQ